MILAQGTPEEVIVEQYLMHGLIILVILLIVLIIAALFRGLQDAGFFNRILLEERWEEFTERAQDEWNSFRVTTNRIYKKITLILINLYHSLIRYIKA